MGQSVTIIGDQPDWFSELKSDLVQHLVKRPDGALLNLALPSI